MKHRMHMFYVLVFMGCADLPNDVVIQDKNELIEMAISDIRLMEAKFETDLIEQISASSNPRYFKGRLPHKKVIAIELVPPGTISGSGKATHRNLLNNRCLIQIETDGLRPNLITHEILHCLGADHTPYGIMHKVATYEKNYRIHPDTWHQLGLEPPKNKQQ